MTNVKVERLKPRDYIAKDLRSPKYRMRTVGSKLHKPSKYPKQELMNAFS